MDNNEKETTKKAVRRFSLRWQLALGMASGFFVIFIVFALLLSVVWQYSYLHLS